MPIADIYFKLGTVKTTLVGLQPRLKKFLARELSCADRELSPSEISIRLHRIEPESATIADVEVCITAHLYPERIAREDEICASTAQFISAYCGIKAAVWMPLPELGHSF